METENSSGSDGLSASVCAEAAAWIARLHGAGRTTEVEAGFRRWLAASPMHRTAFDMANEIWTDTERWPNPAIPTFVSGGSRAIALTLPYLVAAAVILAGALFYFRDPGLATAIGEQRNLTLEDGTRVSLNTATRIVIHYDRHARRVQLDAGEALFEVATSPDRPFIVGAGKKEVTALGTAFIVRRDEQQVAVTLMEGKVRVASVVQRSESVPPAAETQVLAPGQRVTFSGTATPKVDHPALEKVTAWEHGQVIFDHTPLVEAASEMNRYSPVKVEIERPEAAAVQVTGVFRTGESQSFAQAIAETYRLEIATRRDKILLTGLPRKPIS